MKVILNQDIENLGKKYDVVNVKDGYARNFLFLKKMAELATTKALKRLENIKEVEKTRIERELKDAQKKASLVDGKELLFSVKLGDENQLFESITAQKIAEELKKQEIVIVKKDQIELEKPIKELGEFPIKIKLEHNLEVEIMLIITKK